MRSKTSNVTITIAPEAPVPLNPIWRFGGNTCHAPLILRPDLQRHLRAAREQLGFTYIRCHGTVSDDMEVCAAPGRYRFHKVDAMIDTLLGMKLKPFFEISAMPGCLASGDSKICHYGFRSSPPKNWRAWGELVGALATHLSQRYGKAETRSWWFEIWNEPDLSFWKGTRQEYFKLYDIAAAAIKKVDPQLRVGGPATSKTAWMREFVEHLTKPSSDFDAGSASRCDFISTHAYPSDLPFLDSAKGSVKLQNSNIMRTLFAEARRTIDRDLGSGVPLICGEWNSSAGPFAFNHDDANNAAFVIKTMAELSDICHGSLYWNISDIYEEAGHHYTPFHGGYGLINVNGIPKAAFRAFEFLASLEGARIPCDVTGGPEGIGAIAAANDRAINLLVYYHREPDGKQPPVVDLQLRCSSRKLRSAKVATITAGQGSPYERWLDLGKPDYVNHEILESLEAASRVDCLPFEPGSERLRLPLGSAARLHLTTR